MSRKGYDEASDVEKCLIDRFDARAYGEFLEKAHDVSQSYLIAYYRYLCLANGWGVVQDRQQAYAILNDALPELTLAAENGSVRAQNALGVLFERGESGISPPIRKDLVAARRWYAEAAEAGFSKAQCNLARFCRRGLGGPIDIQDAIRLYREATEGGDAGASYILACMYACGESQPRDASVVLGYVQRAATAGDARAKSILYRAGDDVAPERILAEVLISEAEEEHRRRMRISSEGVSFCVGDPETSKPSGVRARFSVSLRPDFSSDEGDDVCYSMGSPVEVNESAEDNYGDEWLLSEKPKGTEVPPAIDRIKVKTPNLLRFNSSFAAKLIKYVRDKFAGDAPSVYRAAHVNRKTYSSIISNELRPVSKRTAVAFALALRLPRNEADEFLKSAGFALSPSILDDMIFSACIDAGIYELSRVNKILEAHGSKPFQNQED